MHAGATVGGRFTVEGPAGAGGIGAVYRARDLRSGVMVALKVLRTPGTGQGERRRFEREATLLAALRHPGIVRYVAHGFIDDDRRFLAMEWVEGRTLAAALAGRAMALAEALAVVTQAAHALGAAHAAGIVHRDVKPSNLMLVGAERPVVKLIDFGLARSDAGEATVTAAGQIVGTPGYLSPEQARGRVTPDARADVFALGCVLYRCLAGAAPFAGADLLAVLTKTVLVDPPSLAELGIVVPDDLDALLGRMLAKDREQRPAHGLEVAARLSTVGTTGDARAARVRLADAERQLVCLVLVRAARGAPAPALALVGDVSAPGARVHPLLDGSVVAVFAGRGEAATDVAARAARWALAVGGLGRAAGIALVATRIEADAPEDLAVPIERAAALARDAARVGVDATAARLLDGAFALAFDGDTATLGHELELAGRARVVGGRPTPFVGRAVELEQIASSLAACIDEHGARAVVVTGPEGIGKSRLRHELTSPRAEGDSARAADGASIWTARADPWSSGAAYALASQLVGRAAELDPAAPEAVRRERLAQRVSRCVAAGDRERVSRFLGVVAGLELEGDDIEARASRDDPVLRGDQIRRAWEDWMAAETAARPLLVVVDDAHWADAPSLRLLDAALRHGADHPLMVLVFARPLLDERFPQLFAERRPERIRLRALSRKSSERFATTLLGPAADAALVVRLCERAGGNPFHLEELVRAALRGDDAAFPETVVAMAEARLLRLEPSDRRLLRAASVLGRAFDVGALAAVLDASEGERQVLPLRLASLVDAEVLTMGPRLASAERELAFSHALLREAAYAMLIDRDRAEAHTRAARWLESTDGADAAVLAGHFERGGVPERATEHYAAAAERALGGNDLDGALELVARGLASAQSASLHTGHHVALLHLVAAETHRWRGDLADAAESAQGASARAPGSDVDAAAVGELASVAGALGRLDALAARADALAEGGAPIGVPHAVALARAAAQLLLGGESARARRLIDAVERRATAGTRGDPRVEARLRQAASIEAFLRGDTVAYLDSAEAAARAFDVAGDLRNGCLQRGNVGHARVELGDLEAAETALRAVAAAADRLGLANIAAVARSNLAQALGRAGRAVEAVTTGEEALSRFAAQGDRRLEAATLAQVAEALTLAGRLDEALAYAQRASERSEGLPPMQALALSMLARVRLDRSEPALALDASARALAAFRAAGVEGSDVLVLSTHGEALLRSGRHDDARELLTNALGRLEERAARLPEAMRAGYLGRVPENARVVRLASELGLRHGRLA